VSCAHRRARYWSPWSSKPEGREDEAGLHSKQAEDASSRKGLPATGSSTKKSGWPKGGKGAHVVRTTVEVKVALL
jgi:hypothetical protein